MKPLVLLVLSLMGCHSHGRKDAFRVVEPVGVARALGPLTPRHLTEEPAQVDAEIQHLPFVKAGWLRPTSGPATYVIEVGPPDSARPPLILVHGLGTHGVRDFYPVLAQLAADRRVIAFDLPLLGRSEAGTEQIAFEAFAQKLADVAAVKTSGPFDLLGHSLGGAVALLYSASRPSDVRRLVLVDVAGVLHREAFVGSGIHNALGRLRKRSARTARVVERAAHAMVTTFVPGESTLEWAGSHLSRPQMQAAFALIQTNLGTTLSRVKAPTLLIWGEEDPIAPLRTADLLVDGIAHAQLTVLDDVGHVPMAERPEVVAQKVVEHLDGPVPEAPQVRAANSERDFSCQGKNDVVLEGDYRHILISECHRVILNEVRARTLAVEKSDAHLIRSEITQGIQVLESNLAMTGARVSGTVGLMLRRSHVDIAGGTLQGSRAAVSAVRPSRVLFSGSLVQSPHTNATFHGIVELSVGQGL